MSCDGPRETPKGICFHHEAVQLGTVSLSSLAFMPRICKAGISIAALVTVGDISHPEIHHPRCAVQGAHCHCHRGHCRQAGTPSRFPEHVFMSRRLREGGPQPEERTPGTPGPGRRAGRTPSCLERVALPWQPRNKALGICCRAQDCQEEAVGLARNRPQPPADPQPSLGTS